MHVAVVREEDCEMTYFIHTDCSYTAADRPTLEMFEGAFHDLLLHLNGMSPDEYYEDRDGNEVLGSNWTSFDLQELFNNANGDGQNYTTVFAQSTEQESDNNPPTFKCVLG
jgi:hypothetical protein